MWHTVRRCVFARKWRTFLAMATSFVAFGIASLNLFSLLKANVDLFIEHGTMAVMDGALAQLMQLLLSTFLSMLFYLGFKLCEYRLVHLLGDDRPDDASRH